MRRLVYSPKVQAYIQTDAGVIDLTEFITSGTVSRVVNEVSTAELTFRNPNKRFTTPGEPTFRPMDSITIFLSRYRNYPVQVFTGYLDETPYFQLYPGTCTLRASCTLKRLMYTYMDAGLPFTQHFLAQYGWIANPATGQATSPTATAQGQGAGQIPTGSAGAGSGDTPQITDGTLGNLMFAVLEQIGKWDKGNIIIEDLPQGVVDTVQAILSTLSADDEELKSEFQEFLKKLIGGSGTSGSGTGTGSGTGGPLSGGTNPEKIFNYVLGQGLDCKAAGAVVGNAQQESGCDPARSGGGLLQWSDPSRWAGLVNFAQRSGTSVNDLHTQLDWMWYELHHGYGAALSILQGNGTLSEKTIGFEENYERAGTPMNENRVSYAQTAVQNFCK